MKSTAELPPELQRLVDEIDRLVGRTNDEGELTRGVAEFLISALDAGFDLPPGLVEADADRYVMYPIHVDPHGRYSIASAVWNVGQSTPVHGHETWGVVGIYAGHEDEVRYEKPTEEGAPLTLHGEDRWGVGQVTICCTTDDDVHQVSCGGDVPCVGIHIYGADIGTLPRRSYDPATGDVNWFTSTWATPAGA